MTDFLDDFYGWFDDAPAAGATNPPINDTPSSGGVPAWLGDLGGLISNIAHLGDHTAPEPQAQPKAATHADYSWLLWVALAALLIIVVTRR